MHFPTKNVGQFFLTRKKSNQGGGEVKEEAFSGYFFAVQNLHPNRKHLYGSTDDFGMQKKH